MVESTLTNEPTGPAEVSAGEPVEGPELEALHSTPFDSKATRKRYDESWAPTRIKIAIKKKAKPDGVICLLSYMGVSYIGLVFYRVLVFVV